MLKKIVKIMLLFSFIVFIVTLFYRNKFPDKETIQKKLYQSPVQIEVSKAPFEKKAGDTNYTITPQYSYELYGMIVSYHHSASWWDYYHEKWNDFINMKDIGVIWGNNIKTEVYKDMQFSSGSWTCYYKWPNSEVKSRFSEDYLSNNHLISTDPDINKEIMRADIGDQIYMKGYLADYTHSGWRGPRKTSVTRTDRGNGACEVGYVTNFTILKKANETIRLIYKMSKYFIIICLILLVFFFFKDPYSSKF